MKLTILQNTVGKKKPIKSNLLQPQEKFNAIKDRVYQVDSCREAENNHYLVTLSYQCGTWYFYKNHVKIDLGLLLRYSQFARCFPHASGQNLEAYFPLLNQTCHQFSIDTPSRIAAFFAQLAHESCCLKYSEEIASGRTYEGRRDLGNIYPGDGVRYKGRGLIQLTGRHNYTIYGRQLGIDLSERPDLAATPKYAALIAGQYWHNRGLNRYADMNSYTGFKIITRRINGGLNGWRDRCNYWMIAKKALNLD
jgi:putative chitinase